MQTIRTKYLGPTNYRGSRYKAVSSSGISLTQSTDYRLNSEENHRTVAVALAVKLEWHKRSAKRLAEQGGLRLVEGEGRTGNYYVIQEPWNTLIVEPDGSWGLDNG